MAAAGPGGRPPLSAVATSDADGAAAVVTALSLCSLSAAAATVAAGLPLTAAAGTAADARLLAACG